MTRIACLVLPLVLACSSKTAPKAPAPQQASIECSVVAEHGVGVQSSDPNLVAKTKTTVAASCQKHAWSEDTKRCIVGAKTEDARSQCHEMLTAEQSAALQADLRAAFEGQPGITVQPAASDNKAQ